ncbi:MAG: hypothetical protein KF886_16785 [Candidatus Hydrogenedentes bacterium]|nr:hypothetical protein [Candidatus Hydrogenedentota bacterium]
MLIRLACGLALLGLCGGVPAQGMMSDVMSGKLVNPEVGVFAWYNLKDAATGQEFFLRQAITGKERVKRKDAYWLETELQPRLGYPSVYKMLLTGPASNPKNVHRLLIREGNGAVREVALEQGEHGGVDSDSPRASVGAEEVALPNETILAERFVIGEGNETTDIWVSDQVPPMGIVKMRSSLGELVLQRYGKGGKDGESAIPVPSESRESENAGEPGEPAEEEVTAGDDREVRRNFGAGRRGRR